MNDLVTILEASRATGVSAKMIRHYESIGLIAAPARAENRYRHYGHRDLHELGFIRRARDLGFSIEDIRHLLALWRDRSRSSAEVKSIAAALHAMSETLKHLAAHCHGDDRPDCPILDALDTQQSGGQTDPGSRHGQRQ
jgi:MerR family copper efflux transcriptional regulator